MKRKKEVQNRVWYTAKLLPQGANIFADSFYNPENTVYFTKIDISPTYSKFLIASKITASSLRIVTTTIAQKCLEPISACKKSENDALNAAATDIELTAN